MIWQTKNLFLKLMNQSWFICYLMILPKKKISLKPCKKTPVEVSYRINGKKLVSKKGFFLWKSVNSWLSNIKHAELVITDSFHCTVFSILFKKKFICIANKHRGVTRIENLLKLTHLESRLVFDFKQINENLFTSNIDFQKVELLLSEEKNKSINFLKNSLEQVKAK
jgi:exopolysaccharide biosynthesis predicted pyruvyltransferase EpsI